MPFLEKGPKKHRDLKTLEFYCHVIHSCKITHSSISKPPPTYFSSAPAPASPLPDSQQYSAE